MSFIPIAIIIMSLGIGCAAGSWYIEYRRWNRGICKESGKPWVCFDTDSHGARGYKDSHGNYAWITWPWIDRSH